MPTQTTYLGVVAPDALAAQMVQDDAVNATESLVASTTHFGIAISQWMYSASATFSPFMPFLYSI
ncbi:MAG: hypothetical protein IPK63_00840 [Candidatus Competibacteraceae bacterium]|nr:hypothetical protein [Candidatus Competibacteraceae bacterium]